MDQPRYVKKKLVTVRCNNPFSYRKIPFAGVCNRVVLEVEAINYALMNKALVTEHLKGNKDIALGFDNYNTYNGPTLINDEAEVFKFNEPEIEMIDGFGNKTIKNKQKAAQVAQSVKHIDLEAQKVKQAEEDKKKKELEIQKQRQEELDRKEALIKEQMERDKKAREEAAAKILADAQAKADQAVGVEDKDSKEGFVYDFPANISTEPKSDFTNSSQQDSKKNYDGGKKDKRK